MERTLEGRQKGMFRSVPTTPVYRRPVSKNNLEYDGTSTLSEQRQTCHEPAVNLRARLVFA